MSDDIQGDETASDTERRLRQKIAVLEAVAEQDRGRAEGLRQRIEALIQELEGAATSDLLDAESARLADAAAFEQSARWWTAMASRLRDALEADNRARRPFGEDGGPT